MIGLLFGQYHLELDREAQAYLRDVGAERARETAHMGDRGGVYDLDRVERCVLGASGEFALCAYLGVPFRPDTFGVDVADRYQVRTRSRPSGELIVQRADLSSPLPYVLVTRGDLANELIVRGWLYPREVTGRPEWLTEFRGYALSHFVPQAALHGLAELPR